MANVNLQTKKIYGTEKGTKTYYHEVAHLKFEDKAPYGNLTRQLQNLSLTSLIFSMAFAFIYPHYLWKVILLILILVSIFSETYEELWCWDYAKKRLIKRDDTNTTRRKI